MNQSIFQTEHASHHNYTASRTKVEALQGMYLHCTFDSIAELIRFCTINKSDKESGFRLQSGTTIRLTDGSLSEGGEEDREWRYGSELKNFKTTEEALIFGTATGPQFRMYQMTKSDLIKKYPEIEKMQERAMESKQFKGYQDEGSDLDIERYMNGDTQAWQQKKQRGMGFKRVARIHLEMPTSASNDGENFFKAMCFAVACSDVLESANISTELFMQFSIHRVTTAEKLTTICVRLKAAEDPLDIERVLSAGNVGLFRNWVFNVLNNIHATTHNNVSGGLGVCLQGEDFDKYIKDNVPTDLIIYAEDVYTNKEGKIKQYINRLGELLGHAKDGFEYFDWSKDNDYAPAMCYDGGSKFYHDDDDGEEWKASLRDEDHADDADDDDDCDDDDDDDTYHHKWDDED